MFILFEQSLLGLISYTISKKQSESYWFRKNLGRSAQNRMNKIY